MKSGERGGPGRIRGYSVTAAANGYANITGLVSGFALAAVVLSITVAGTTDLRGPERLDVGFASALFAVAFLGCLICAFSLASLSGEEDSPAVFTCALLVGSGISVCLLAVLSGFAVLASAFLEDAAPTFIALCLVGIAVAPPFVFSPQWDIVMTFGPGAAPGIPKTAQDARRVVLGPASLGLATAVVALAVRIVVPINHPSQTAYLIVASVALVYTAFMVLAAIAVSSWTETTRLSARRTWALGAAQSIIALGMVVLIPA